MTNRNIDAAVYMTDQVVKIAPWRWARDWDVRRIGNAVHVINHAGNRAKAAHIGNDLFEITGDDEEMINTLYGIVSDAKYDLKNVRAGF